MCNYCDENSYECEVFRGDNGYYLDVETSEWDDYYDETVHIRLDINYCPYCGRKLDEEETYKGEWMLVPKVKASEFKKFGFKRCKGIPKESECYYLCVARGCKMLFVSDVCFAVNDWNKDDPRIHKDANCRYRDKRTALDIIYELIKADMLKSKWEIEEQPTAYDVEKVIEELEEELKLADDEKARCIKENPMQFDSAKGYANGIAVAIEIVKRGGRDEE